MTSRASHIFQAAVAAFCFLPFFQAGGQNLGRSFDFSMDPRTIALGEGGAALSGSTDPFTVNPAGLASRSGIWAEYTRRGMEWLNSIGLDGMRYRSWSAGAGTPYGTFAFTYRRFDQGEFAIATPWEPDGAGMVKMYDQTFGIAWAGRLSPRIQAGGAVKFFKPVSSGSGGGASTETNTPILVDIGIVANSGPVFLRGRASDEASGGIALQNFGTNLRTSQTFFVGPGSGTERYTSSEQLPRSLRLGAAYQVKVDAREPGGWAPLRVIVTGDLQQILNSPSKDDEHYFGYGLELTAYEIVSIRLGGYFAPVTSVYGEKDVAAIRYGVGLDLPFARFSPGVTPITVSASYTAIPLYSGAYYFNGAAGTANVFSVSLKYQ